MFREIKVWHIQMTTSDHCALVVECVEHSLNRRRRKRNFWYENMWQTDPSYMALIHDTWHQQAGVHGLGEMQERLQVVQTTLGAWDQNVFGSVKKTLAALRKELEEVRGQSVGARPSRREKRIMARITEMLSREEIMERQRSRLEWLKDGDRNTAMFQAKSRARARRKKIGALRREDGSVVTSQEEVEATATEFYRQLFSAQANLEPELVLDHVPVKVTEQMNDRLSWPYTATEVERALHLMKPSKAPGPDGFTAGFYQLHWDLLGKDITAAVLNFLNGGPMPDDLNRTAIVLIPKVRNLQEMKEFRPISLCNVLYKICSKVLALRLREILDEIIAEEQSAFVPGCLITDNVLIAYECIHYLKRRKGKAGACAIKLDMAKAYDRVEWEYLRGIMLKLGLHSNFVSLIMRCVSTVSFSININGNLTDSFRPTRGIRQGDPISPYLFLLCSEGLSCLLKDVGPMHLSRGIRVDVHSPRISHLLLRMIV